MVENPECGSKADLWGTEVLWGLEQHLKSQPAMPLGHAMSWCLEEETSTPARSFPDIYKGQAWNRVCERGPAPGSQLLLIKINFISKQAALLLLLGDCSFELGQMRVARRSIINTEGS